MGANQPSNNNANGCKVTVSCARNLPRLRESWQLIEETGIDNLGRLFYRNLFDKGGEPVRRLFAGTDMEKQQRMLMAVAQWCLSERFEIEDLRRVAISHADMGITLQNLSQFLDTLLSSMRMLAGSRWRPIYDASWQEVFQLIIGFLGPEFERTTGSHDLTTIRSDLRAWFFDQGKARVQYADCAGYLEYSIGSIPSDEIRQWTCRYFELHKSMLYIFRKPESKPERALRMARYADVVQLNGTFDGTFTFVLTSTDKDVEPVYFKAEGETPMEKWMCAFATALQRFSNGSTAPSLADLDLALLYGQKTNKFSVKDFEFKDVLGHGSFGQVMKVCHRQTKRVYAVKVIDKEGAFGDVKRLEDMHRETSILVSIDHPFIVKLHGVFQSQHFLFLVFDFLSGGELLYHLKQQPQMKFDEAQVKFYIGEIALAISYLHDHTIMHRDLKTDNIVLNADGHAILTDFGFSKVVDPEQKNISTCGTLAYLAPEVLKQTHHGYGYEVDWWSLGVVAYAMLTGCYPFLRNTPEDTARAICGCPLRFPPDVSLSHEAMSCVQNLLEKNPANRLANIRDLAAHPWFADVNFNDLFHKRVKPPFVPDEVGENTKYFPLHERVNQCCELENDAELTEETDIFLHHQDLKPFIRPRDSSKSPTRPGNAEEQPGGEHVKHMKQSTP